MNDEMDVRLLWRQVPPVNCKGLCVDSCGPVPVADEEAAILERQGIAIDFDRETLTCNQLKFGRCMIYEDRPLLCRLWGAVPEMPCVWGCQPTLTSNEGRALLGAMYGMKR